MAPDNRVKQCREILSTRREDKGKEAQAEENGGLSEPSHFHF